MVICRHEAVTLCAIDPAMRPAMAAASDYVDAAIVIETEELQARLDDESLRVIDCNMQFTPKPEGGYDIASGLADWQAAHVPNSVYIDIAQSIFCVVVTN